MTRFKSERSSLKNPLKGLSKSAITKQSIEIENTVIMQIARERNVD